VYGSCGYSPSGGLDARRVLAGCDAVLLDLNGTLMFGGDRFGAQEDFAATYEAQGGRSLPPSSVSRAVRAVLGEMGRRYDGTAHENDFPALEEVLLELVATRALPAVERRRLVDVIAAHECGTIPPGYAGVAVALARTHRLGIVTNIWSPKRRWLDELTSSKLLEHLGVTVFSSDTRSVKPSRTLFALALHGLGKRTDEAGSVAFIGDSVRRDIEGAKAVGMRTIWIDAGCGPDTNEAGAVDARICDLCELAPTHATA